MLEVCSMFWFGESIFNLFYSTDYLDSFLMRANWQWQSMYILGKHHWPPYHTLFNFIQPVNRVPYIKNIKFYFDAK